jgi:hypothetical protein
MSLHDTLRLFSAIVQAVWRFAVDHAFSNPWAVGAALFGLARSFGVQIQSGQRGVLFRWGKVVKELEPGFHWLVPLVHAAKKTPVRSITIVLPDQKVMTADGLVYHVGVNFVYRVDDATRALTLVDHVDVGCRAAVPIIVTELIRVRDQAQLVDRVSLDRELFERVNAWIARWGLVLEQAGFTTIAPNKRVLATTQLRSLTTERATAMYALIEGGLDPEFALVMIGSPHRPMAKTSRRYHIAVRKPGHTTGPRCRRKKVAGSRTVTKAGEAPTPVRPPATESHGL